MMYLDGKPYFSLNSYYKQKFGRKIAKLSLDAGFSCPNRDGTLSTGGCTFCSTQGSGDFTLGNQVSITQQLELGKQAASNKWKDASYVAYFQAYTNTYAPVDELRKKYEEALSVSQIIGLSIATRPDCLPPEVLDLLQEIHKKTALWVELGLQSCHETTAHRINRGYPLSVFETAVAELHQRKIDIVVHVILGLPGETLDDMLQTIHYLNTLPIQGVKLQLLHVLENTPLAQEYQDGRLHTLSQDEYIHILCQCIGHLRPDIVLHRITGDGNPQTLLAPRWSLKKRTVLNFIHKTLKNQKIRQGCLL